MRPVLAFEADAAVLWRARGRQRPPCLQGGRRAFPLTGDQDAVVTAGRAAIESLSPAAGAGGDGSRGGRRRVARGPGPAQDDHAAGGSRGQPAPGARLRPRPAHAVQARRDVLRRAASSRAIRVKRELRVDWAAALKTVVDQCAARARKAGARRWSPSRPTDPAARAGDGQRRSTSLPMAERPEARRAAPMECLGADRADRGGGARRDRACPSGRNADTPSRSCSSRARGGCRPMPRTRCASSSNGSPAITTSRWRRSMPIRARCSRSRT